MLSFGPIFYDVLYSAQLNLVHNTYAVDMIAKNIVLKHHTSKQNYEEKKFRNVKKLHIATNITYIDFTPYLKPIRANQSYNIDFLHPKCLLLYDQVSQSTDVVRGEG